jgi:hypothetical protein
VFELPAWYDVDDADGLRVLIGEAIDGKPFRTFGSRATAASATRRYLLGLLETSISPSGSAVCTHRAASHDTRRAAHPIEARPSTTLWLALAGAGLAILTAAGPTLHHRLGGWALIVLFAVGGLAACSAARLGEHADQRTALLVILAGAVAMRLSLLLLSSPTCRATSTATSGTAACRPPASIPIAMCPRRRSSQPSRHGHLAHINRPDYAVTIYPPAAQAIFLAVHAGG